MLIYLNEANMSFSGSQRVFRKNFYILHTLAGIDYIIHRTRTRNSGFYHKY